MATREEALAKLQEARSAGDDFARLERYKELCVMIGLNDPVTAAATHLKRSFTEMMAPLITPHIDRLLVEKAERASRVAPPPPAPRVLTQQERDDLAAHEARLDQFPRPGRPTPTRTR